MSPASSSVPSSVETRRATWRDLGAAALADVADADHDRGLTRATAATATAAGSSRRLLDPTASEHAVAIARRMRSNG